jgi:hypothetical protein
MPDYGGPVAPIATYDYCFTGNAGVVYLTDSTGTAIQNSSNLALVSKYDKIVTISTLGAGTVPGSTLNAAYSDMVLMYNGLADGTSFSTLSASIAANVAYSDPGSVLSGGAGTVGSFSVASGVISLNLPYAMTGTVSGRLTSFGIARS